METNATVSSRSDLSHHRRVRHRRDGPVPHQWTAGPSSCPSRVNGPGTVRCTPPVLSNYFVPGRTSTGALPGRGDPHRPQSLPSRDWTSSLAFSERPNTSPQPSARLLPGPPLPTRERQDHRSRVDPMSYQSRKESPVDFTLEGPLNYGGP